MGSLAGKLKLHRSSRARRAGPHLRTWLAAVVWLALAAAPAAAQDPRPTPRDPAARDTLRVPIPPEAVATDTLPGDSLMPPAPDSLRPAPELPVFPDVLPQGFAFARWEWSRDDLLRYRGLSLLDLLEQVPGVLSVRSGGFGRAAGLSGFGSGGGAVRVIVDGYEIDPMGFQSLELQAIGLIDLESLRVERSPGSVRVEVRRFRLPDARAYSEVEAGAGNYGARLLRATLSRVAGSRSVVRASYDLASTSGIGLDEQFQARSGKLAWTYQLAPETGIQLELQQGGADRTGGADPVEFTRRDLVLRARSEPVEGLSLDGLVGRSSWISERSMGSDAASDTVIPDLARTQALLRAAWITPHLRAEASARHRGAGGGVQEKGTTLHARGSATPVPWITVEGQGEASTRPAGTVTSISAGGRVGPFLGFSGFGTVSAGERWIGTARDTAISYLVVGVDTVNGEPRAVPQERSRVVRRFGSAAVSTTGFRLGAEWTGAESVVGLAAVSLGAGPVHPFGVFFDRGLHPVDAGPARGVEGYASVPVPWTRSRLRLHGSGSVWQETGDRPYLPTREARVALEYHTVRIDNQFEPTLRIEAVHRGPALVPNADRSRFDFVTPPYTLLNLFLQIRVLDVRAFLIWENPTHNRAALDLPPGPGFQPGQRVVYGARWSFRN
jgi:hypothetical protein